MADRDRSEPPETHAELGEEGFLRRWARRKSATEEGLEAEPEARTPTPPTHQQQATPEALAERTDADMPALETLGADSDYSGFLSPKVSEELRRAALRKLFRLPQFNVRDGLDDYDADYRNFTALGDIITADMRHHMENLAREAQAAGETPSASSEAAPQDAEPGDDPSEHARQAQPPDADDEPPAA